MFCIPKNQCRHEGICVLVPAPVVSRRCLFDKDDETYQDLIDTTKTVRSWQEKNITRTNLKTRQNPTDDWSFYTNITSYLFFRNRWLQPNRVGAPLYSHKVAASPKGHDSLFKSTLLIWLVILNSECYNSTNIKRSAIKQSELKNTSRNSISHLR